MRARPLALCGVLAALATALLALGGVLPGMVFCAPILAMGALLPVLEELGPKAAGTAYAAVAILALLLVPDRETAFVYLFFGWYPILRPKIAACPPAPCASWPGWRCATPPPCCSTAWSCGSWA